MYICADSVVYIYEHFVHCQGGILFCPIFLTALYNFENTGICPRQQSQMKSVLRSALINIMNVASAEPQLSTLIRLADFYQVSLDTLVGHSSPPLKQSDD